MKSKYLIPAAAAFLLLLAVLTNPGSETHKESVRAELKAYFKQEMSARESTTDENDWAKAGEAFGNIFATALIDRLVDNAVTSENYVLFSLTKVTWEGKEKNVGFGAFGNVWLSSKLRDLKNKTE
ncbi:DUF4359 domain-containing protein [Flavobacterium selenitireducens]|uniref:DUF4359 domain-containing protein n=1 Tax=Flavobacterium selenitireducens TaxID=2722704 RepID=UPI00168B1A0C|nr:DUF4359 domain-containing protein [Flavobacterium selenitireducens]MBD3581738.1 DUF4359 domain-containing protein [Flavobacterium selenitireducens]